MHDVREASKKPTIKWSIATGPLVIVHEMSESVKAAQVIMTAYV